MEEREIVNRVANSGLITIDLAEWIDDQPHKTLDIAPWLFQNLILKEKDFRGFVDAHDWMQYSGAHVSVFSSADAIIPLWAYMLIGGKLADAGATAFYGKEEHTFTARCRAIVTQGAAQKIDTGSRIIIKGCNKYALDPDTYLHLAELLKPAVRSLMYGEACSTVPIYKNRPAASA